MLYKDRDYPLDGVADSGDDVGIGDALDLRDSLLLFAAVWLGVLASLFLAALGLSLVLRVAATEMFLTPIQLLVLIGQVVKRRALADWYASRSRPVYIRVARVFLIGFLWPLWIGRS